MQNISQALLMVGSVILGVILMAALIYMLRVGGSVNKAYDETQLSYQTEAFNYQYEVYQRDDNSIMDIVTLFNLAFSANEDNGYSANNSIIIVVKVGNKTYQIPKDINTKNIDNFFNNNYGVLKRNQVYDTTGGSNAVMSVYDLLDKSLKDLGISGIGTEKDWSDKLSKIHMGKYVYYPERPVGDPDEGKPDIGVNGTTYKYIFDCNDNSVQYNKTTGRISKMEFECKINPYWELGSYYSLDNGLTKAPEWDD